MSEETLENIRRLVQKGEVRVSEHGYDELSAEGLFAREVVEGLVEAILVEDYPDYAKGPSVLVLQQDQHGNLIHVVWGIPKDRESPAVVVTAYRPDPERWSSDYKERRQ